MTRRMFNGWHIAALFAVTALTFNACTNATPDRAQTKTQEQACQAGRPCEVKP